MQQSCGQREHPVSAWAQEPGLMELKNDSPSSNDKMHKDRIKINSLSTSTLLKTSAWASTPAKVTRQPIVISLDIPHDISRTALTDTLEHSVDYSTICTAINKLCDDRLAHLKPFASIRDLAQCISTICLGEDFPTLDAISVEVSAPKTLLHARKASVQIVRRREFSRHSDKDIFTVEDLTLAAIIGLRPHERLEKQMVAVNIRVALHSESREAANFNFPAFTSHVASYIEMSSYFTLETLTSQVARRALFWLNVPSAVVTVGVAKPSALPLAESPEIIVTRTLTDFRSRPNTPNELPGWAVVAIALGSNVGDRVKNIESALRLLEHPEHELLKRGDLKIPANAVTIVDTSFMYETAPMYVVDQPRFMNCACLVQTVLDARILLRFLKAIEEAVGRTPGIRFGPRVVDLDIIVFDNQIIDTRLPEERLTLDNLEGHLVVPHPRMADREFVLRPLNDIIPEWIHPLLHKTVNALLGAAISQKSPEEAPMTRVFPFPAMHVSNPSGKEPERETPYWTLSNAGKVNGRGTGQSHLMAILNVTPDSFSDGSQNNTLDDALAYVAASVAAGADIVDIGGYSTRPGADFVSTQEEIQRVVPVIQAIRQSHGPMKHVLISVDTFRWEVAKEAVLAGANCINDVYSFTGPEYPCTEASWTNFNKMKEVIAELGVPAIMMHSRGDAGSNKDYSACANLPHTKKPIINAVRLELGEKVDKAVRGPGGIRRWLVMVDPGLGFSKSVIDNLDVLKYSSDVTADVRVYADASNAWFAMRDPPYNAPTRNPLVGFPQLIGASRKSFLGKVLAQPSPPSAGHTYVHPGRQTEPSERGYATAATVTCAVQQGAAVIRVHDVQEMSDVVRIASAIWN